MDASTRLKLEQMLAARWHSLENAIASKAEPELIMEVDMSLMGMSTGECVYRQMEVEYIVRKLQEM